MGNDMDINCKECNQKYHIPDNRLDERRVYFICEKCGNRVVIEGQKDPWSQYRGRSISGYTARDMLDGIFFSFNKKNILISFFLLVSVSLLLAVLSFIVRENMAFFTGHMVFSLLFSAGVVLFISFAYDLHLYLLSRNIFNRIANDRNIIFSKVRDEILHDSGMVFIFSAGFILCLMLLLVPVPFLKSYGLIYSGIFYPVLFSLSLLAVLAWYLKNILYAFVALKSRSARHCAASIVRFLAVENINIPVYMFLTGAISTAVLLFLSVFFLAAVLLIPGIVSLFHGGGSHTGVALIESVRGMMSGMPVQSMVGAGITGIMLFLFVLLFLAYLINLKQAISVMCVHIMESNPGRSVSRTGLMVFFILFTSLLLSAVLPVLL